MTADNTIRDAELSVLGSVLFGHDPNDATINTILDRLTAEAGLRAEHFAFAAHQSLFRAMLELADEGEPIDPLTLAAAGVQRALLDVAAEKMAPTLVRQRADLIKAEHRWRLRKHAALQQLERVEQRDETGYQAATLVDEPDRDPDALHTPQRMAGEFLAAIRASGPSRVIPTPWEQLNVKMAGGFYPGNTSVLAAWSSHGKSVVTLQCLEHIGAQSGRVCLYTNEMPVSEIYARWLAGHAEISFDRLLRASLNQTRLSRAEEQQVEQATRLCFVNVIPCNNWPVEDICRHIRKSKWDLCALDLFNRVPGRSEGEQAASNVVERLCDAAAASDAHLILNAQLNRGRDIGRRKDMPHMRDLKETSALEQAPANVMFVYRESLEQEDPMNPGMVKVTKLNTGVIYLEKGRNCDPNAAVDVRLDPDRMRYDVMRSAA